MAQIRPSDASIFRMCRRRWYFSSPFKMNLEPIAPQRRLWVGTGVHEALAAYYGNGETPSVVFGTWAEGEIRRVRSQYPELGPEAEKQLRDDYALGVGVLQHYETWAPTVDNFEVVWVEREFTVDLGDDITVAGRADALVHLYEGTPSTWLLEHKTARVVETDRLVLEEQPGVYLWGLQKELGVPIEGIMYNFLRTKVPTMPWKLVAGGLSKAKNIDTTYEVYLRAIEEAEGDPEDYSDILEILRQKGNTFFRREYVRRNQAELEQIARRYKLLHQDMSNPDTPLYPNPHPILCKMCPYRPPCIAMSDGSDWKFILKNQYRPREEVRAYAGDELGWDDFAS